jgi:Uncharacterized conserved protein
LPIELSIPLPNIDLNFRPIVVNGRFDHSKEMLFLRKYGEQTGYKIVTPFFMNEKTGFLVNRGWVPLDYKKLSTRKENFDVVTISGVLREGETPSYYTPTNSPNIGEWYFMELPLMAKVSGLENEEAKE